MPPWKIERAQKQSRGWSAERLAEATRVAADCNAAVKGGSDDRGYALERAVFALVAAADRGGSAVTGVRPRPAATSGCSRAAAPARRGR